MLYTILFVLIGLDCLATTQTAERRFDVQLHSLTCTSFSPRVKHLNCQINKLATSRYGVDTDFELDTALAKDAEVRVVITVKMTEGGKSVKFLDIKLNICDTLSTAMTIRLAKEILEEARRTSNLPQSCPINENFLYKMTNYSVTDASFPPYTPFINFNFSLNVYENQKLSISSLVMGSSEI